MPSPIVDPIEHELRMAIWWYIANELWGNPENNLTYGEILRISDEFFVSNITIEELRERYARGERNFVDVSLPHKVDFTGISLAGANLKGAKFNYSNFTEANLEGTDLSYAWLNGVNFTRANLHKANISWAAATGAVFKDASLLNAIGRFNTSCDALYENTIMPSGNTRKSPYRPFG